jgi:hypothetical protein
MVPSVWENSTMLMSVCWEDGCSGAGEEREKEEKERDAKECHYEPRKERKDGESIGERMHKGWGFLKD